MGRGQAVRRRVLVPLLGGSNPSVPERLHQKRKILLFNNFLFHFVYSKIQPFVLNFRNNWIISFFFSFGFSQTRSNAWVEIKIFLLILNSKKHFLGEAFPFTVCLYYSYSYILKLVTWENLVFHIRKMGILTRFVLKL